METFQKYGDIARSTAKGKGAPRTGKLSPGQLKRFTNEPLSCAAPRSFVMAAAQEVTMSVMSLGCRWTV